MRENGSASRLTGRLLAAVTVVATCTSFAHALNCHGARWATCYERLKTAVEENRAEEALSIISDLLAAGHKQESHAKLITGMTYSEYYVYYYQARALLKTGAIDAAREAAAKTRHPQRDELLSRIQPPRLVLDDPTLIETQFEPAGGKTVEHAVVHVSGIGFDNNGLESIKAKDVVGQKKTSFESDGKGFKFESEVTVDPSMGQFELIATDTTGLS